VVDVDLQSFFDELDHSHLRQFLQHRLADRRILRLIGKWLTAGVLEEGKLEKVASGAPQGAGSTPPTMLQNVVENSLSVSRASSCARPMDMAFVEPRYGLILRNPVLGRSVQEALVRNSHHPQGKDLAVKRRFEPSHVAAECLAHAYERLVPILRRAVNTPRPLPSHPDPREEQSRERRR
jgi:hypothetical protein